MTDDTETFINYVNWSVLIKKIRKRCFLKMDYTIFDIDENSCKFKKIRYAKLTEKISNVEFLTKTTIFLIHVYYELDYNP